MLKLTKLTYEVSDKAKKKIENVTEIYQEQVVEANVLGRPVPKAPTVKLEDEDYDCTESVLYLDTESVESVELTAEKDTQIVTKTGGLYLVKESPEEIVAKITESK